MAIAGQSLILKRASASRPSGEWSDDDFDVLADGVVVVNLRIDPATNWTLARALRDAFEAQHMLEQRMRGEQAAGPLR
jgi:hypothetical protein